MEDKSSLEGTEDLPQLLSFHLPSEPQFSWQPVSEILQIKDTQCRSNQGVSFFCLKHSFKEPRQENEPSAIPK